MTKRFIPFLALLVTLVSGFTIASASQNQVYKSTTYEISNTFICPVRGNYVYNCPFGFNQDQAQRNNHRQNQGTSGNNFRNCCR